MLGAGVVGYGMRKCDFEPAPLVVGLVLGTFMERSFRQALILSRGDLTEFVGSPLLIFLTALVFIAAFGPPLLHIIKGRIRAHYERSS